MTIGTDTIIFGAIAVFGIVILSAHAWAKRILREIEARDDACLNDEDMRDDTDSHP